MSEVELQTGTDAPAPKPGVLKGDAGTERAMVVICALLVGLAGFFVFAASLGIPFNGRDLDLFGTSRLLHRLVTVPEALSQLPHAPLTAVGFALNWALGMSVVSLHVGNLLLHVVASILVYLCARRLVPAGTPEPFAMLGGLLLAVGPVAAGAVDVVAERAPIQAACFGLLAFYVFLRASDAPKVTFGAVMLCAAAYAAAFGSHFAALALPLVFLGADFSRGGVAGVRKNGALHGVLFFFLITLATVRSAVGVDSGDYAHGFAGVLHGQGIYLAQGLLSVFFVGGAPLLPQSAELAQLSTVGMTIAAIAALLAVGAVALRAPAGAGLWWLLMIGAAAPCLTPKDILLASGEGYLAIVGLALALPALVARLPQPGLRMAGALVALAWCAGGAFFAVRETSAWTEPAARWQAEADRTQSAEAWRYVAEFALSQPPSDGAPDPQAQAMPALQQWRAKAPDDARAAALLGGALLASGKPAEALPVLQDALRLNPWNGAATAQVADILEQRAREEGRETLLLARDYYRRANELGALSKEQLQPYALVLAGVGDLNGAAAILKESIGDAKDGPAAAMLRNLQAGQAQIAGREKKINELFSQKDGGGTQAVVGRAEVEYLKGRFIEAFYLLDRVLRKENDNAQAWSLLGLTRARMQAADAFLAEDAALPAANAQAWDDLVKRCAASNLWDAALTYIQHAPGENPELRLATIAQERRQPQRAEEFLKKAADKAPADPLPWLRLCDLSLQGKDIARANACLAEAQKRGASEEQLKPLRDQLGTPATPGAAPMQKIVN